MTHSRFKPKEVPSEILETDRVVRGADKEVHRIDAALRRAMTRSGLDPRLRTEMQYLLEALSAVKVNLSVIGATLEVVSKEAEGRQRPNG